jgi:hypothetical protein
MLERQEPRKILYGHYSLFWFQLLKIGIHYYNEHCSIFSSTAPNLKEFKTL